MKRAKKRIRYVIFLGAALFTGFLLATNPSATSPAQAWLEPISGYSYKDNVVTYGKVRYLGSYSTPRATYMHMSWNDPSHIYEFFMALANASGTRIAVAGMPNPTPPSGTVSDFLNTSTGGTLLPAGAFYMQTQFKLLPGYTDGWRTWNGAIDWT